MTDWLTERAPSAKNHKENRSVCTLDADLLGRRSALGLVTSRETYSLSLFLDREATNAYRLLAEHYDCTLHEVVLDDGKVVDEQTGPVQRLVDRRHAVSGQSTVPSRRTEPAKCRNLYRR
ncbi:hypothetical protein [Mycobacterium sp. 141]|uniref:hypothetical protein n=1 Tax=Mycobacterium sp. 141 TaxID=1120797 RepID=UPI0012DEF741|nr:hypothetical protein [Mycobacterium sp. 141]